MNSKDYKKHELEFNGEVYTLNCPKDYNIAINIDSIKSIEEIVNVDGKVIALELTLSPFKGENYMNRHIRFERCNDIFLWNNHIIEM